jgi:hypothetical protein
MFHRLRKIVVDEDGDGRVRAVVTGTWFGRTFTAVLRTSPNKTGLWAWDERKHDWRRVVGPNDFKVRTANGFRRRLGQILVWKQEDDNCRDAQ